MKVVLDTNIIISGLYSKRGASYQLLQAAISGELTFVISPLIAFEYEGKVYQKIEQDFLKVSKEDCGLILDAFFAAAEIIRNQCLSVARSPPFRFLKIQFLL